MDLQNEASNRRITTKEEVLRCHPLMRQLRPHLQTPAEFAEHWQRQAESGYLLIARWLGEGPVALAGYRVTENLVHGRHLYVDDLVTEGNARNRGHGRELLHQLKIEAKDKGCSLLVLDSGLTRAVAHRFYFREGLTVEAFHFTVPTV